MVDGRARSRFDSRGELPVNPPTVSVVICTYNRAALLGDALDSVLRQSVPPGIGFETVVVDDGSTDDTAAVVRQRAGTSATPVRYVRISHGGVSAARNAGLEAARGDWIAFMDDDEIAYPDWLANLLCAALAHDADCVSGRNEIAIGSQPFELAESVRKLLGDNSFMAKPGSTVLPGCGNALIRRSVLAKIDGFDPALVYGEDADFFRRARRAGARIVFAPDARITHLVPKHRLETSYLFAIARAGAESQVSEDFKDGGTRILLRTCFLRFVHLGVSVLPRLLSGWLGQNPGRLLGARSTAQFGKAYLFASGRLLTSAVTQAGYAAGRR
jgi:glycosyltransferase involved in cell wall biosynthesis